MSPHTHAPARPDLEGAVLFGRFAFPPDERGYSSPDRAADLVERVTLKGPGADFEELACSVGRSWPYLAHIADCLGRAPLDPVVVEAYWLGEPVLDSCGGVRLVRSLEERFEPRLTRLDYERLAAAAARGAIPSHTFQVFGVSPWVAMMRGGSADTALQMLDRCRIRWGQVTHVEGDRAVVESQRLTWDGRWLGLGEPDLETARFRRAGHVLAQTLDPGDWVALHWDWVAERIGPTRLTWLRHSTVREIDAVNSGAYPARASAAA